MKKILILLVGFFTFFISYSQEIDSAYYFNMNDSILKVNGVFSYENIFLIDKNIKKLDSFALKWRHSKDTINIIYGNTDYFYITYDYDLKEFGEFSFESIIGVNRETKKNCYAYYEPSSFLFFKYIKKKDWNKKTFNLDTIVSIIESRKEVEILNSNPMQYSVLAEGECKDKICGKGMFGKYNPYSITIEAFYKDNLVNSTERIILSGGNYGDYNYDDTYYFPTYILNSIEFIEVMFVFETSPNFFRLINRRHSKQNIDYDVFRYHQIKLSIIDHKVISDGLFSSPSGMEH